MNKYEIVIKGNDTFVKYDYIDAKNFLEASLEAYHILRACGNVTIEQIEITSVVKITV